jgi:hypothetical protein
MDGAATIASLALPAGTYLIDGAVGVQASTATNWTYGYCVTSVPSQPLSIATAYESGPPTTSTATTFILSGVVTITTPETVKLACNISSSAMTRGPSDHLSALAIGTLH